MGRMQPLLDFLAAYGWAGVAGATAVMLLAGFVKGAVGFALPLIGVSGLGVFLPGQTAVAILILPILIGNFWQSGRAGLGEMAAVTRRYALMVAVLLPTILVFSQFLDDLSDRAFYTILGAGTVVFSSLQLAGWRPAGVRTAPRAAQVVVGLVGGVFGGLAGVWGPPVTLYMVASQAPKHEAMTAQGMLFGLGGVMLGVGVIWSGVFNLAAASLSAVAVLPMAVGMAAGFAAHDRLHPQTFRRITLVVLVIAGLNLLRRGLIG